jgi:hypothetical protein
MNSGEESRKRPGDKQNTMHYRCGEIHTYGRSGFE